MGNILAQTLGKRLRQNKYGCKKKLPVDKITSLFSSLGGCWYYLYKILFYQASKASHRDTLNSKIQLIVFFVRKTNQMQHLLCTQIIPPYMLLTYSHRAVSLVYLLCSP